MNSFRYISMLYIYIYYNYIYIYTYTYILPFCTFTKWRRFLLSFYCNAHVALTKQCCHQREPAIAWPPTSPGLGIESMCGQNEESMWCWGYQYGIFQSLSDFAEISWWSSFTLPRYRSKSCSLLYRNSWQFWMFIPRFKIHRLWMVLTWRECFFRFGFHIPRISSYIPYVCWKINVHTVPPYIIGDMTHSPKLPTIH